MIITAKKTIELVLEQKTKDFSFRLYETKVQKWLFWASVGAICLGALIALTNYFWKNKYAAITAIILLLSSEILAAAYQVASIIPEVRKLRNVEREMSNPLLTEFNADMDLISELSQVCEAHHLQYAQTNYLRMARQLRERIAVFIGAIDRVGIVPLAITGYFSYVKAQKDGLLTFGGLEWVSVAFVLLYLFSMRMIGTAQWMEKVAEIYAQAISLQEQRKR